MEALYSYVLWYNHYQETWYAIDRNTELEFFNGSRKKAKYYSAKNLNDLIKTVKEKCN